MLTTQDIIDRVEDIHDNLLSSESSTEYQPLVTESITDLRFLIEDLRTDLTSL